MMDLIDISASAIEERDRLRELLNEAAEHQRDLVRRAAELLRFPAIPADEWTKRINDWFRDAGIEQ